MANPLTARWTQSNEEIRHIEKIFKQVFENAVIGERIISVNLFSGTALIGFFISNPQEADHKNNKGRGEIHITLLNGQNIEIDQLDIQSISKITDEQIILEFKNRGIGVKN